MASLSPDEAQAAMLAGYGATAPSPAAVVFGTLDLRDLSGATIAVLRAEGGRLTAQYDPARLDDAARALLDAASRPVRGEGQPRRVVE